MTSKAMTDKFEKENENKTEARTFLAIDLKSFYASVECVEKGLDPLTTNLVVADESRTEKTICLAVTPALKRCGISGRPRLFEVNAAMKEVNRKRRQQLYSMRGQKDFSGSSWDEGELAGDPSLKADFLTAVPRMALYMDYSTRIYRIYLKYVAPEDIHAYSIDEVFIDATSYLKTYQMTARDLAKTMIREVLDRTGITAAAGIAPNLYLCKAAMDIVAKHVPEDADGVRVAELTERSYREMLWTHRPLTDFWRIGRGYAKKLEQQGMYTMGDIARCSLGREDDYYNEDLLYRMFGVNAELLIDHAWGWEPCTMAQIKAYQPADHSMGTGQVLPGPYDAGKARIVVHEMADQLALSLVEKQLVTDQVVLTVVYDKGNLNDPEIAKRYRGEIKKDYYGREAPKPAHGSRNLGLFTSSSRRIIDAVLALYDDITNPDLMVRRLFVTLNHVRGSKEADRENVQMNLFSDYGLEKEADEKEQRLQEAILSIRRKFGNEAVLKGVNLEDGATGRERSRQIGGHRA